MDCDDLSLEPYDFGKTFFPRQENGKINTLDFLEASRGVVKLIDKLGKVFSPLSTDISSNIEKIKKCYDKNPSKYVYIEDMILCKKSVNNDPLSVDALLWLRRALHFILVFFQNILNDGRKNECLQEHMPSAYSQTLEPYHGETNNGYLGHWLMSWILLAIEIVILNVKIATEVTRSFVRLFVPPEEVSVVGEKVLITGTGHGIGKELARQYGALGAEVVCVDVNPKTNRETVAELRKMGAKAVGLECDVSRREEVLELRKKVKAEIGDITILVNNAGIMPTKRWKDHTPEDILRIFEINVFAHFWMFEAFIPGMVEKNYGHIVGVSSVAGKIGAPYVTAYCGSKFAVRGIMEALAEEFRAEGKNIKFTTIYPYMTNTGLCKKVKIRFPALFTMQDPKYIASQIISAQRKGFREGIIPSYMGHLHDFGRLFPEKTQMDLIDFLDTGLCVE